MSEGITKKAAIYSTFGDDPDLGDLVELFVDEMPSRVDTLLRFSTEKDWNGLQRTAHQIKGAAGSYGFSQLTSLAAQLEEVLHGSEPEDAIQTSLEELVNNCRRIRAGVPA